MRATARSWIRTVIFAVIAVALVGCEPAPPPPGRTFTDYSVQQASLGSEGEAVRVATVGPAFFPDFQEAVVVLGRSLDDHDFEDGAAAVVVLSQSFLMFRFGDDPDVVGRTMALDGVQHVIVGVVDDGEGGPEGASVYVARSARQVVGPSPPEPARTPTPDPEALSALGVCADGPVFTTDDFVIAEVRTTIPEGDLHLVRLDAVAEGVDDAFAIAVPDASGGCRAQRVALRPRSDGSYRPSGVSSTGVPVVGFAGAFAGGSDGDDSYAETYVVRADGEAEMVSQGRGMSFTDENRLLFDRARMLDPGTGQSLAFADVGDGRVFRVFRLDATAVLLLRCVDPLCWGVVGDEAPRGWAQVVRWDEGITAELSFLGFEETTIDPAALWAYAPQGIVLLDQRLGTVTLVRYSAPDFPEQHNLTELPEAMADEDPANLARIFSNDPEDTMGGLVHHFYFGAPGEPPRYRVERR